MSVMSSTSTDEKIAMTLIGVVMYLVFGAITVGLMTHAGVPWLTGEPEAVDTVVVMVFWPLFAVKYIVIFIFMIFETLILRLF